MPAAHPAIADLELLGIVKDDGSYCAIRNKIDEAVLKAG
jgi:hypothetical protein